MEKRKLFQVLGSLGLVLLLAALLAACAQPAPSPSPAPSPKPSPSPSPAPSPSPSPAPKPSPSPTAPVSGELPSDFIGIASGTGKTFTLTAYFTEMMGKNTKMKASLQKTSGSTQDLDALNTGKAHITFISTPTPAIMRDKGNFHVRVIASAGVGEESATVLGFFTKTGRTDIKKFSDLKGKRVYYKPTNAFSLPVLDALSKVNNMKRSDMTVLEFAVNADAFRELKEGRVDVIFFLAGSDTQEMGDTVGMFVIPLSPEEQKAVTTELPYGAVPGIWHAGKYGNKIDTPTFMAPQVLFTGASVSDLLAYTMTKVLFDHIADFQASQPAAADFTLKTALTQWAIPYHAGAIAYYKEKGIWTAEHEAKNKKLLALEKATK